MKQLVFEFYKEGNPEYIIQFPLYVKEKLIKQMAIVIIKVHRTSLDKISALHKFSSQEEA